MKFLIILSVIFIVGCSSQELLQKNASNKPEQNFNYNDRENLHSNHTYVHKCPAFILEQDKNKKSKSCH